MNSKKCSKCGEVLPVDAFYKCSRAKDGLQSHCKECKKQHYKANTESIKEYRKQYYKANTESIKEYHKQYYKANNERIKKKSEKYYKENKEIAKKRQRQYYLENAEKIKERARKYRKENPEKERGRKKQYYKDNAGKISEKGKQYRKNNAERIKERKRQYRKNNPEKVKAAKHRRRALNRSAPGYCTAEQLQARLDYHDNRCVYCGSTENMQVEHKIPLAKGGSNWPANIAPACGSCNRSKGDRLTFVEFRAIKQAELAVTSACS